MSRPLAWEDHDRLGTVWYHRYLPPYDSYYGLRKSSVQERRAKELADCGKQHRIG